MRRVAALLSGLALLASLMPIPAGAVSRQSVIVVFRAETPDPGALAAGLARRHDFAVGSTYQHALKGFAATLPTAAIEALRRHPQVAWIEPDGVALPSGDQAGATWGLDRLDQRALPLDASYHYDQTGAGVTAYVIDSGVRITHADFGGRASYGWDFYSGDAIASDCNGHGTHVAGTIGGATYGVAKAVNLVSLRVFGCTGGSAWSTIIAAVDWVTANAQKPAVVNMSLGGGANSAIDTAVRNSIASGISYAIAAGNESTDACSRSPARVSQAMTIGATDRTDTKVSWSNFGSCVDWFAPGVSITSASYSSDTGSTIKSGTSMATPHTAGVAALRLETSPSASPADVQLNIAAATTQDIVKSSNTFNDNLLHSLSGAADTTPPAAPSEVVATAGDGSVQLDWADVSDTDLAGYIVHRSATAGGPYTTITSSLLSASSYVDATVANGTTYHYVVTTVDAADNESEYSNETSATPMAPIGTPDNPPSVSVTSPTNGEVVSGTVPITAAATDDVAVSKVEFYADGLLVGSDSSGGDGWTASWDSTTASDASHLLSATATDSNGQAATHAVSVTVDNPAAGIVLTAQGYKLKGLQKADLSWTGAVSAQVDIYRNGTRVATVADTGAHTDHINRNGNGTYVYQMCAAGTTTACSNEVTVIFR